MSTTFTAWTRRRWVTAAVLAPGLAALFAAAAPTRPPTTAAGWWAGLLLAAGVGSLVLASYVPVLGRRPDLGCTPCAAVSGVSLVGAVLAFASYGPQAGAPLLATVATGFGLMQRVTRQRSCAPPTPAPPMGAPDRLVEAPVGGRSPAVRDVDDQPARADARVGQGEHPERKPGTHAEAERGVALEAAGPGDLPEGPVPGH